MFLFNWVLFRFKMLNFPRSNSSSLSIIPYLPCPSYDLPPLRPSDDNRRAMRSPSNRQKPSWMNQLTGPHLPRKIHGNTLQGTNISPKNGILKMIFLFPRWDMLVPWRVFPKVCDREHGHSMAKNGYEQNNNYYSTVLFSHKTGEAVTCLLGIKQP